MAGKESHQHGINRLLPSLAKSRLDRKTRSAFHTAEISYLSHNEIDWLNQFIATRQENLSEVAELITPDLLQTYLEHYPPRVLETLTDVFSKVKDNLDSFGNVLGSQEYQDLRDRERAFREDGTQCYTLGLWGCVDGRIYLLGFGLPLNLPITREPAGMPEINDLELIDNRELMQAIKGKLDIDPKINLVQFVQTHTALGIEGIDDGHFMGCGAIKKALGENIVAHPDNGVKFDLIRKNRVTEVLTSEIREMYGRDRVSVVPEIYDTDSLGLVYGAEILIQENPDIFFTKEVITKTHQEGRLVFTTELFKDPSWQTAFANSGIEIGSLSDKIGKPEYFLEVGSTLVNLRDLLQNKFGEELRSKLHKIYGEPVNKLERNRIDAVIERICWNMAFQYTTKWSEKEDHPLRHHNEFYIAAGTKSETNGLVIPFWTTNGEGTIIAASLFSPYELIPYLPSTIAEKSGTDATGRAMARVENNTATFLLNVLSDLKQLVKKDHSEAEKYLSLFLDESGKLRFIILPPLLLQETTREVLEINSNFVRIIIPEFHSRLLELRSQLTTIERERRYTIHN